MRRLLLVLLLTTVTVGLFAQTPDKAVLATPEVSTSQRTDYRVFRVVVQRQVQGRDWLFEIHYMDNLGNEYSDAHYGVDADGVHNAEFYVKAFNTLNFAARSLECRALDHLKGEGKIPANAVVCGS